MRSTDSPSESGLSTGRDMTLCYALTFSRLSSTGAAPPLAASGPESSSARPSIGACVSSSSSTSLSTGSGTIGLTLLPSCSLTCCACLTIFTAASIKPESAGFEPLAPLNVCEDAEAPSCCLVMVAAGLDLAEDARFLESALGGFRLLLLPWALT